MSKKDFKRGVEAAIKTNEAFMRKQAAATEELGKRIIQKIDDQGKIIDVILDTLNDQEKKELYELQSEYDIADLGQNEKEVLASYLLTLIAKYEQDTIEQKDYYFAVKKHLEVTDVSDNLNLALVENVDSRAELKAMFKTVCEFLFLKTGDLSFLDTFENEIEYFGLTAKAIREIINPIVRIYNMLGLRGIVEHYIPVEPEENLFPDHYGLIGPLVGEFVFDDSNRDIPEGTERIFENLKVVFPKQLHIDGKAVFKNCELVFDYSGTIALYSRESTSEVIFQNCEFKTEKQTKLSIMSITGKCDFKDCLFSNLKYRYGNYYSNEDMEDYNCSFIDVDGYEDGTAIFTMEHCRVEGCEGTFINADGNQLGNNFNVTIKNCSVENHIGNFLLARYADRGSDTGVYIRDSSFVNIKHYEKDFQAKNEIAGRHDIGDWDWDWEKQNYLSLINVESVRFYCENNTFENVQESTIEANTSCLSDTINEIKKCKFKNCLFFKELRGIIDDCDFDGLQSISFGNCGEFLNDEVRVINSRFVNHNGKIDVSYGKIEHCSFADSTLTISVEGKPIGKDVYHSSASDLTFTNCVAKVNKGYSFMDSPCFLQAKSYLDKPGLCVVFNGCKFNNCRTSGNYINVEKKIFGAFDRVKTITLGREYGTSIK